MVKFKKKNFTICLLLTALLLVIFLVNMVKLGTTVAIGKFNFSPPDGIHLKCCLKSKNGQLNILPKNLP